jgi:hypothetical protein
MITAGTAALIAGIALVSRQSDDPVRARRRR